MHDFESIFAIIDAEGSWLKIPNTQSMTLIVSEVSGVIVENMTIKGGFSYRINYDIRNLYQYNWKTLKYVNKHYPNSFRNKLVQDSLSSIPPNKCRQLISNLKSSDGVSPMPLYAKGNRLESIWLHYPQSCDGNYQTLPKNIERIGEVEHIVPNYDSVPNKMEILSQNISKINIANVSEKHILQLKTNINHHHSLYECIVFATKIIENNKKKYIPNMLF